MSKTSSDPVFHQTVGLSTCTRDSCGPHEHRGSLMLWMHEHIPVIHRDVKVCAPAPPPPICKEEIMHILNNVKCIASKKDSQMLINPCSGEPIKARVSAVVFAPGTVYGQGDYSALYSQSGMQGAVEGARAKAHTAFAFSTDFNYMSSALFGRLSAKGKPWDGQEHAARPNATNLSQVAGGIPIYRDGHLIGGLGVDGDSPSLCEEIAIAALGEHFAAPAKLKEKAMSML